MARKTAEITIATGDLLNRDEGKSFIITEKPAAQAEAWAIRALGVMARAGLNLSDEIMASGTAGLALFGLQALVSGPYEEIKPLFDEMMECVQIVEPVATRAITADDIEEATTRFRLRDEVFKLHAGFSIAASLLAMEAAATIRREMRSASSDTPISPEPSEPPSPPERRRSRS